MIGRWATELHGAFVQRFTLNGLLGWLMVALLIARGVAFATAPHYVCRLSPIKVARISIQDLQSIADGWRPDNDNACPTPARLKLDRQMSAGSNLRDPWDSPYEIVCEGKETIVVSLGPDQIRGTADDLQFPPPESSE